jgi:hypothetical protein
LDLLNRDLVASTDIQKVPIANSAAGEASLILPWNSPAEKVSDSVEREAWGQSHCIVAVDGTGLFVALSYRDLPDLVVLPEFELALPAFAVPVLRGVPRLTPGEALPTHAELWLDTDETGSICAVRARPSSRAEVLRIVRDTATREAFSA